MNTYGHFMSDPEEDGGVDQESVLLKDNLALIAFQQKVGVREPFLRLLSRKCLQSKILNLPILHYLGDLHPPQFIPARSLGAVKDIAQEP